MLSTQKHKRESSRKRKVVRYATPAGVDPKVKKRNVNIPKGKDWIIKWIKWAFFILFEFSLIGLSIAIAYGVHVYLRTYHVSSVTYNITHGGPQQLIGNWNVSKIKLLWPKEDFNENITTCMIATQIGFKICSVTGNKTGCLRLPCGENGFDRIMATPSVTSFSAAEQEEKNDTECGETDPWAEYMAVLMDQTGSTELDRSCQIILRKKKILNQTSGEVELWVYKYCLRNNLEWGHNFTTFKVIKIERWWPRRIEFGCFQTKDSSLSSWQTGNITHWYQRLSRGRERRDVCPTPPPNTTLKYDSLSMIGESNMWQKVKDNVIKWLSKVPPAMSDPLAEAEEGEETVPLFLEPGMRGKRSTSDLARLLRKGHSEYANYTGYQNYILPTNSTYFNWTFFCLHNEVGLQPQGWELHPIRHTLYTEWVYEVPNFKHPKVVQWMKKDQSDPTNLDTGFHAWNEETRLCLTRKANNSAVWQGGEPLRIRIAGAYYQKGTATPDSIIEADSIFEAVNEMIRPTHKKDFYHSPTWARNYTVMLEGCQVEVCNNTKGLTRRMCIFWYSQLYGLTVGGLRPDTLGDREFFKPRPPYLNIATLGTGELCYKVLRGYMQRDIPEDYRYYRKGMYETYPMTYWYGEGYNKQKYDYYPQDTRIEAETFERKLVGTKTLVMEHGQLRVKTNWFSIDKTNTWEVNDTKTGNGLLDRIMIMNDKVGDLVPPGFTAPGTTKWGAFSLVNFNYLNGLGIDHHVCFNEPRIGKNPQPERFTIDPDAPKEFPNFRNFPNWDLRSGFCSPFRRSLDQQKADWFDYFAYGINGTLRHVSLIVRGVNEIMSDSVVQVSNNVIQGTSDSMGMLVKGVREHIIRPVWDALFWPLCALGLMCGVIILIIGMILACKNNKWQLTGRKLLGERRKDLVDPDKMGREVSR
nr:uncharacterized protein LOC129153574 [Nothobranchius furzeri]